MPFRDLSTLPPCDWPEDDDPSPTLVPDDGLTYAIGHESSQIRQDRDVAGVTSLIVPRRTIPIADPLSAYVATARALLAGVGPTRRGLEQLGDVRRQIEAAEVWLAEALLVAGPGAWGTYDEVSADLERDPTPEPAPRHQHWAQREDWRQDGDQRTATQRCGCGAVRVVTWPRYSPGCEPLAVGAWTGQAPPALGPAPEDGDYYYVSDHGGPVVTTLAGLDVLARRDCDRHAAATETAPRWRDAHEVG
jgi:hypothetical protein